jgi:lipopolysaccharide/colanic/teichoic acid biosynthesis glycosyltransferase
MFQVYKKKEVSVAPLTGVAKKKSVKVRNLVAEYAGEAVSRFVSGYGDPCGSKSLVISSVHAFNSAVQSDFAYHFIVNLQQVNSVQQLCGFLCEINRKLEDNGRFICCLETTRLRRQRIFRTHPPVINRIYYFFDYLIKRVAPNIKGTRWIYNILSSGSDRPISYYEMVGRLAYCGFESEADEVINGRHYLVARKFKEAPIRVRERYGLLLKLERIGKDGKIVNVYKFRTMVAFSEYVQEHIYRRNHLCKGGKFKNDTRVTILGGFVRRFWIDELPMLYNFTKGEMKLVGVRPVSAQYLSLYDSEVVRLRTSVKPGLIPPFYADMPETLEEIQDSEVRYIRQWQEKPLRTDFIYLFKALRNIVVCGARSK